MSQVHHPIILHHFLCWRISCSVGALETSAPPKCATVCVRRPIRFRPPSDRFPSAVGGKVLEKRCKNVVLNGNTIGDFAIFDVSVFRCFYYPHPNNLCISVKSVGESLFAWLVHLRQVHPLKLHLKSVGEYSVINSVSSAYFVGEHSVRPSMKSCFFVQFRRLLEKNAI